MVGHSRSRPRASINLDRSVCYDRGMVAQLEKKPSPRQKLLAAADELFYNEGIHAVGIDRVIERAGVARGSLYYNFSGKDDLIKEYLLGRHARWTGRVEERVAKANGPAEKILAVFDALGALFAEPSYRGCAFVNAIAEAKVDGPETHAAAHFRSWLHALFGDLTAELPVENPLELADQLVILYDGAVAGAQMDSSPKAAATAKTLASMIIGA
jgi:AcrR family transcriptional regulator